jgi:hypothetical protein
LVTQRMLKMYKKNKKKWSQLILPHLYIWLLAYYSL